MAESGFLAPEIAAFSGSEELENKAAVVVQLFAETDVKNLAAELTTACSKNTSDAGQPLAVATPGFAGPELAHRVDEWFTLGPDL